MVEKFVMKCEEFCVILFVKQCALMNQEEMLRMLVYKRMQRMRPIHKRRKHIVE